MTPTDTTPLRILYVEDDGLTAHNTLAALAKVAETDVRHCRRWSEAEALVDVVDFDVAVLDVHLVGSPLDGIDIGHHLSARHRLPLVITTGAQDDRTLTRLAALPRAQYLLKPFTHAQLRACLRRVARLPPPEALADAPARSHLSEALSRVLFLPVGHRRLERVDFAEVDYLSADGAYTDVVLGNGRRRTIDRGLRAAIRFFGRDDVLQVHKSYAVPVHAIAQVRQHAVNLRSGGEVPIGRTYRPRLHAALRKADAP